MNTCREHAVAVGETHEAAFEADEAPVDRVELLDEAFDAGVVERQALHVRDDLLAQLVVGLLLLARALLARDLLLELLVLLLAQLLVGGGDVVEGLEHLGLELGLHGRERQRVLEIVLVVHLAFGARLAFGRFALACRRGDRHRGGGLGGLRQRRRRLGLGTLVGGLEIDDVAEQNLAVVELVAPDDDGLEGQRAFAQAGDHGLAAGLDALGDGDLALARQQLDRAHLAQIHAHGIVRALGGLGARLRARGKRGRGDGPALFLFGRIGGDFLLLLAFLGLDDVDPHVGEHRHRVLDLVGRDLLRRQNGIQLVQGHVAARLGRLQQTLNGLVGQVEERAIALGGLRRCGIRFLVLRCICHVF